MTDHAINRYPVSEAAVFRISSKPDKDLPYARSFENDGLTMHSSYPFDA